MSIKEEVVCKYVVENINLVLLVNINKIKYIDQEGKSK